MTEKMAVVCNGDSPACIMPRLIFSTSGLSLDYEVHIFICPAGARWVVKGELEKPGTPTGDSAKQSG
jgi:predicted peroxiredoxin